MAYHVIGDRETILGFRFAGVQGDAVATEEEARAAFSRALSSPENVILIITEKVESMLAEEVNAHRLAAEPPYITVIPDIWGPRGTRRSLQDLINEAVGVRLSNDDEEQK